MKTHDPHPLDALRELALKWLSDAGRLQQLGKTELAGDSRAHGIALLDEITLLKSHVHAVWEIR